MVRNRTAQAVFVVGRQINVVSEQRILHTLRSQADAYAAFVADLVEDQPQSLEGIQVLARKIYKRIQDAGWFDPATVFVSRFRRHDVYGARSLLDPEAPAGWTLAIDFHNGTHRVDRVASSPVARAT